MSAFLKDTHLATHAHVRGHCFLFSSSSLHVNPFPFIPSEAEKATGNYPFPFGLHQQCIHETTRLAAGVTVDGVRRLELEFTSESGPI